MKRAFLSAVIITVFTFSSQVILFIGQMVAAAQFGAGSDMDAFVAASALPQYLISVLLGSLGYVYIPFFVDYKTKGDEQKAYQLTTNLFNFCILFLGIVSFLGIIFSEFLLRITAPGLSPEVLKLGVKVAIITWPTILASGALSLLLSFYQAEKKYGWQAIVPFLGAIIHLSLLILLAPRLGVLGLAVATTAGVIAQVILLVNVITKSSRYQFKINWNDPSLHQILKLTIPLVLVAIVTKFTPVIDRYLASNLQEGSISHLNYAFKVITVISVLVSTGAATVIFPKMAQDASGSDIGALRNTLSLGLRSMWLIIAPLITIGLSLSLPVVVILFKRGAFTLEDSIAVSDLLKIYLLALISMSLGNVTGKGFYVLKDTRTLAIFGTVEVLAYAVYTVMLTRWLGITGIAIGYVIYFNLSLLWQVWILRRKLGNSGGATIMKSFGKTFAAALAGGGLTYVSMTLTSVTLVQLVLGGLVGLIAYLFVLLLLGSTELKLLVDLVLASSRKRKPA